MKLLKTIARVTGRVVAWAYVLGVAAIFVADLVTRERAGMSYASGVIAGVVTSLMALSWALGRETWTMGRRRA